MLIVTHRRSGKVVIATTDKERFDAVIEFLSGLRWSVVAVCPADNPRSTLLRHPEGVGVCVERRIGHSEL